MEEINTCVVISPQASVNNNESSVDNNETIVNNMESITHNIEKLGLVATPKPINNIYDISNNEFILIQKKINRSYVVRVCWFDGWRRALYDDVGLVSVRCISICREMLKLLKSSQMELEEVYSFGKSSKQTKERSSKVVLPLHNSKQKLKRELYN